MAILHNSSQLLLVDARAQPGSNTTEPQQRSGPGYRHVERSRLVSSPEISAMFGKETNWFGRHRNRKALEKRGFPNPIIRGRWLRTAVEAWMDREGTRTALEPRKSKTTVT
jgi:predicted DNA-binding transcriptional regulator AlpA